MGTSELTFQLCLNVSTAGSFKQIYSIQILCRNMYVCLQTTHTIQIINEGEEPDNFFWVGLGGRRKYDKVGTWNIITVFSIAIIVRLFTEYHYYPHHL